MSVGFFPLFSFGLSRTSGDWFMWEELILCNDCLRETRVWCIVLGMETFVQLGVCACVVVVVVNCGLIIMGVAGGLLAKIFCGVQTMLFADFCLGLDSYFGWNDSIDQFLNKILILWKIMLSCWFYAFKFKVKKKKKLKHWRDLLAKNKQMTISGDEGGWFGSGWFGKWNSKSLKIKDEWKQKNWNVAVFFLFFFKFPIEKTFLGCGGGGNRRNCFFF